jgi:biopolymer transport protein ExbD
MAFSVRAESSAIAQINVTPLVDVLLVLLIIFMITAPVVTHRTRVDLPAPGRSTAPLTEPIRLSIQADGSLYWNDAPIGEAQLASQLAIAGAREVPPRLIVRAADGAAYQTVARVLAQAKAQGVAGIDFEQ